MNDRGSLSLESIFSVFAFISLILVLILLINSFYINEVINQSLYKTAIEMSSNNIATQYTNSNKYIQESGISMLSKNKLEKSIKYNIKDHIHNMKLKTGYSFKKNSGFLSIKYSIPFLKQSIKFKKVINYNSFLHGKIPISFEKSKDIFVYITNTGKRYHKASCFHLRLSKTKTNLQEAIKNGYTPCKHCLPKKKIKK